jgi:hypothetical protein
MKKLGRIVAVAALRLRGVKVTALVGRSGSGKSFRARLIAEKRGIEVIIDDGLVISGGTILTGHWAKKERYVLAAVRRALFAGEAHAREAREALRRVSFRGVLIAATSRRMAQRIAANLWLPPPAETISIEDMATRTEITAALRRRGRGSTHSSPVPQVRIRRHPLSRLRSLVTGRRWRDAAPTARIVAPSEGSRGTVFFHEAAVSQMVLHCVQEFDPRIHVRQVLLNEEAGWTALELSVRLPAAAADSGRLHDLRDSIIHGMERQTGLLIRDVRLVVDEIETPSAPGM